MIGTVVHVRVGAFLTTSCCNEHIQPFILSHIYQIIAHGDKGTTDATFGINNKNMIDKTCHEVPSRSHPLFSLNTPPIFAYSSSSLLFAYSSSSSLFAYSPPSCISQYFALRICLFACSFQIFLSAMQIHLCIFLYPLLCYFSLHLSSRTIIVNIPFPAVLSDDDYANPLVRTVPLTVCTLSNFLQCHAYAPVPSNKL